MVSIYGVLEKWAAKQEDAPKQDAPSVDERGGPSVQTRRYYFYEAPPESSIKFTALNKILSKDSPEKQATIEKLRGGNTGKMFADYFVWKAVAVRTNKYSPDGRTFVSYYCELTPFGGKVEGTSVVAPQGAPVTAETVEKDLLLFEDKAGNSNIVNLDKTSQSVYVDGAPPQNAAGLIAKNVVPAGNKQPYEEFAKKFDEYRIWIPNMRQLLLPDFEKPTHDALKGGPGHYVGGERAFQEQVAPYAKEQPEEEASLGDKMVDQKKPDTPSFKPGTEPVKPTDGKVVDKNDSALRTAYDLRESARRVVAQLNSSSFSMPSATGTKPSANSSSIPISHDPEQNKQVAKALNELAVTQERLKTMQQK